MREESPLAWLARRKMMSSEAIAAGERLRRDWTMAQKEPRITMDWAGLAAPQELSAKPTDGLSENERALAARERLAKALDVVGPELSGMLLEVCCLSRGMEAAERALGLPQRSGKVVLELALTRLARHYGLLAKPSHRPAKMQQWALSDYRPHISQNLE